MSGSWADLDGRRRSLGQAPPPPSGFYQPPQPFNPAASLLPMPPTRYASSGNSELSQPASPFAAAAAQQHPAAPQPAGGGILSPRSRLAPPPTALPVFSQPLGNLRPSAGQGSNPEPARPPRRLDLEAAGELACRHPAAYQRPAKRALQQPLRQTSTAAAQGRWHRWWRRAAHP